MYRIDNATSVPALPTPGPVGINPNGYFISGNPETSELATIVDQDWLNAIQEELCFVITQAGITLSKTTRTQLYQAIQSLVAGVPYAASTSTANTYTASLTTPPVSYTNGFAFSVKFANANTGAATLNLNGLGAEAITKLDGSPLQASDIYPNMIGLLIFDGSNFQLLNAPRPVRVNLAPVLTRIKSGSGNYTIPAGCLALKVKGVGGGAGGAGSYSGSGAGTAGTVGGSTTFGSYTAGGGGQTNSGTGGGGGVATASSSSALLLNGQNGQAAVGAISSSSIEIVGGSGGNSPFYNGAGFQVSGGLLPGSAAIPNTGGGGSGAGTNANISGSGGGGGGGGAGFEDLITGSSLTALGSSVAYSIGAGGTAGTAGTSGQPAGPGGSGMLEITAYFQ